MRPSECLFGGRSGRCSSDQASHSLGGGLFLVPTILRKTLQSTSTSQGGPKPISTLSGGMIAEHVHLGWHDAWLDFGSCYADINTQSSCLEQSAEKKQYFGRYATSHTSGSYAFNWHAVVLCAATRTEYSTRIRSPRRFSWMMTK